MLVFTLKINVSQYFDFVNFIIIREYVDGKNRYLLH